MEKIELRNLTDPKLITRTEKRISEMKELGLIIRDFGEPIYLALGNEELNIIYSMLEITNRPDETWNEFVEMVKAKILEKTNQDTEEIHDQIGVDPIIDVAPVQIIDEEEPPVMEESFEEKFLAKTNQTISEFEQKCIDFIMLCAENGLEKQSVSHAGYTIYITKD